MARLYIVAIILVACAVASTCATAEALVVTLTELPARSAAETRAGINAVSRLYISSIATDWGTARQNCKDNGYRLVTIKNEAKEFDVLFALLQSGNSVGDFWIGLNDIFNDGHWVWEDSSALVFSSWASVYEGARNPVRNCASIEGGSFKWYSYPCSAGLAGYVPMRYICETIV